MARANVAETKAVEPAEVPANGAEAGSLLTLDAIMAADDVRYDYVEVPEWGGRVRVKSLTGSERNRITRYLRADMQAMGEAEAQANWQVRVVAASLVDENGNHIAGQNDVPRLASKGLAPLMRIWPVAARLSGLGDEDLTEALNDLKRTPSAPSGSD